MDLSRALRKFAKTTVYYWDAIGYAWVDTGKRCRLQVYDRFISERSFGQKKRILTLPGLETFEDYQTVVKLGSSNTVFLVESFNEDMEADEVYGSTYAIHEAPYRVQLCTKTTVEAQSGVKRLGAEQVVAETWVDMERYSALDSREFSNTDYTIYTITFPRGLPLTTDHYVRNVENGEVYDINEIYQNLNLPAARCQRRG